jgi:uncharacterized phiE125 gp8 family phage protein
MPWTQLTSPAGLAVNLADVKSHLRVTTSDEDGLLELYINAATQIVESKTRRALISRTFRLELETFQDDIEIPIAPLVSVQSVRYYDSNGTLTTWDSANYLVDATRLLGIVRTASGVSHPSTQLRSPNAVQVNFTAGHGATFDAVPEGLRFIVILLAGHYFLNRAPMIVGGGSAMEIPHTLSYAIDSYRIWSP